MQVSLKKPPKIDLSKTPLETLREYTPEHIMDEPAPQEQREYTPVHEREEIIPDEHEDAVSVVTNKIIFMAKCPERNEPVEKATETEDSEKYTPFEIVVMIIAVVVIIAAVILVTWFVLQTPVQPSANTVGSEVYEYVQMLFDFISGNPLFTLMFGVSFVAIGLSFIRGFIDRM